MFFSRKPNAVAIANSLSAMSQLSAAPRCIITMLVLSMITVNVCAILTDKLHISAAPSIHHIDDDSCQLVECPLTPDCPADSQLQSGSAELRNDGNDRDDVDDDDNEDYEEENDGAHNRYSGVPIEALGVLPQPTNVAAGTASSSSVTATGTTTTKVSRWLPPAIVHVRNRRDLIFTHILPAAEDDANDEERQARCCNDLHCVCRPCRGVPVCAANEIAVELAQGLGMPGHCCATYKCVPQLVCDDTLASAHTAYWRDVCTRCSCFGGEELCQNRCQNDAAKTLDDAADGDTDGVEREAAGSCFSEYLGKPMLDGDSWLEDSDCSECSCLSGERRCYTNLCAAVECAQPVKIKGKCCPVCPEDLEHSLEDSMPMDHDLTTPTIPPPTPKLSPTPTTTSTPTTTASAELYSTMNINSLVSTSIPTTTIDSSSSAGTISTISTTTTAEEFDSTTEIVSEATNTSTIGTIDTNSTSVTEATSNNYIEPATAESTSSVPSATWSDFESTSVIGEIGMSDITSTSIEFTTEPPPSSITVGAAETTNTTTNDDDAGSVAESPSTTSSDLPTESTLAEIRTYETSDSISLKVELSTTLASVVSSDGDTTTGSSLVPVTTTGAFVTVTETPHATQVPTDSTPLNSSTSQSPSTTAIHETSATTISTTSPTSTISTTLKAIVSTRVSTTFAPPETTKTGNTVEITGESTTTVLASSTSAPMPALPLEPQPTSYRQNDLNMMSTLQDGMSLLVMVITIATALAFSLLSVYAFWYWFCVAKNRRPVYSTVPRSETSLSQNSTDTTFTA